MLNKVTLENHYISEKKSIPDISSIYSIPRSRIRKMLIDNGIALRTKLEGVRLASYKMGLHNIGKKRPMSDATKEKIRDAKLKSKSTKGTRITPSGYIEFTTGENKGRSQHVVLIEDAIGRRLNSDECVHHINEIKTDNRVENLQLMTKSAHISLHAKQNYINRTRNELGRFE